MFVVDEFCMMRIHLCKINNNFANAHMFYNMFFTGRASLIKSKGDSGKESPLYMLDVLGINVSPC